MPWERPVRDSVFTNACGPTDCCSQDPNKCLRVYLSVLPLCLPFKMALAGTPPGLSSKVCIDCWDSRLG